MELYFLNDVELAVLAAVAIAVALAGVLGFTISADTFREARNSKGDFVVAVLGGTFLFGFLVVGFGGLGYLLTANRTPMSVTDAKWTSEAFGGGELIMGVIAICAAGFCTLVGFGLADDGGWHRLWKIPAVGFALAGVLLGGSMIASEFYASKTTVSVVDGYPTDDGQRVFIAADGRELKVSHNDYDDHAGREFPFSYTCSVHVFPVVKQASGLFGACSP